MGQVVDGEAVLDVVGRSQDDVLVGLNNTRRWTTANRRPAAHPAHAQRLAPGSFGRPASRSRWTCRRWASSTSGSSPPVAGAWDWVGRSQDRDVGRVLECVRVELCGQVMVQPPQGLPVVSHEQEQQAERDQQDQRSCGGECQAKPTPGVGIEPGPVTRVGRGRAGSSRSAAGDRDGEPHRGRPGHAEPAARRPRRISSRTGMRLTTMTTAMIGNR